MTKRFFAAFLAVSALVFIPVGFVLSGCASIPWEKRAMAIEKAACLAQSEALEKAMVKPGYGKALMEAARDASRSVMESLMVGRQPDPRDLQTLAEAEALLGGVVECL